MPSDAALLADYAETRNPDAFSELVTRHAGLVYATCLRVLRDPVESEDATQDCFLQLAQAAGSIHGSLPGWLHSVAFNRAAKLIRGEVRRKRRERESAVMRTRNADESHETWRQIAPQLDQALSELPSRLRDPVIRHYLERQTQEQIAESLGISQPTVSRYIEKGVALLRKDLKRKGVIVPVALLGTLLSTNAVHAAPATVLASLGKMAIGGVGAGASVSAGAATGTATAAGGISGATAGGIAIMKVKTIAAIAALAAIIIAVGVVALNSRAPLPPPQPVPAAQPPQSPADDLVVSQTAEMPKEDVARILESQAEHFQQIASIEFRYDVVFTKAGEKEPLVHNKCRFAAKGPMFLTEHLIFLQPEQQNAMVWAFDGKHYQSKTGHVVTISSKAPEQAPYMLGVPVFYTHLFGVEVEKPLGADQLRSVELWKNLASKVRSQRKADWQGYSCEVLEIAGDNPHVDEMSFEIYFAEELAYFPIRSKGTGRTDKGEVVFEGDLQVTDVQQIAGPGDTTIVIPTEIVTVDYDGEGNPWQTGTYTIEKNSLKVNADIADSAFTLPVGENDRVFDADLGKFVAE